MVDINQFIYNSILLEGKTIEEVTVKDVKTKKKVDVAYYCYDKESLDKVSKQYEHVDKYFYLARLKNKSTWIVNLDEEYSMNTWQPNGKFIYCEENEYQYTYKELLELIEKGETMLVIINK